MKIKILVIAGCLLGVSSPYLIGITPAQLQQTMQGVKDAIQKLEATDELKEIAESYAAAEHALVKLASESQIHDRLKTQLISVYNKKISKAEVAKLEISAADVKSALKIKKDEDFTAENIKKQLEEAKKNIEEKGELISQQEAKLEQKRKELKELENVIDFDVKQKKTILASLSANDEAKKKIITDISSILEAIKEVYLKNKVDKDKTDAVFKNPNTVAAKLKAYLLDLAKARDAYEQAYVGYGEWDALSNRIPDTEIK